MTLLDQGPAAVVPRSRGAVVVPPSRVVAGVGESAAAAVGEAAGVVEADGGPTLNSRKTSRR